MHTIKEKLKKIKTNKKALIIIAIILLCTVCIIPGTIVITREIQKKNLEGKPLLEYEIKGKQDNKHYQIIAKVNSVDGIEKVEYKDINDKQVQLNANGKLTIATDLIAQDQQDFEFKIKIKGKEETTEILHFEIPKIQGKYTLDEGVYVNEPDLTGYNQETTRYLNIDQEGNIQIGNWINQEKSDDWYNYKEREWANIYVESNGLETYYTWIPRYCFKLDQDNQTSDVKFIDTNNNYKDENGNITTWEELEREGYQVPEAFEFEYTWIPGYWMQKYTVGDRDKYTIDFEAVASKSKIKMQSIRTNTTETIAKYTYAINGNILKESTTAEDFEYEMTVEDENTVNITALNEKGEVIGSMTKGCRQAKVNEPDTSNFKQETTFYVTYDENGNEHSTVPLTESVPENWYDYADSKWANIVTRNNGLETYYTWIPRYEFKLDQTSQRSNINFLEGTTKETSYGYQIPEAFTFDGKEIPGYWYMKYTVGTEAAPKFNTEIAATSSSIKTKGITGTGVSEGQVYKYYINGQYKGQKENASDEFEFSDLNANTKYTILVEIRNTEDEYIGSALKEISTVDANKPELTGFNSDMTYYVVYDDEGNERVGDKIKNDGSNVPSNWYNYSNNIWANIVVTDGKVENGQITDATKTTYYTWIPRYEFNIEKSQQTQPTAARTEVRFLSGTSTETDIGYQIPEAFTFDGKEIPGYWYMKYTVGN